MEAQSLFSGAAAKPPPRKRGRPKKASSTEPPLSASPQASTTAACSASTLPGPSPGQTRATSTTASPTEIAVNLQGPLVPQAKRGRLAMSPLHDAMLQAQEIADREPVRHDQGVEALASYYFDPSKYHLASTASLRESLQLDSTAMQSRLRRLAATLLLTQLHERWALERFLTSSLPASSLRLCLDSVAFDETPMKLGIQAVHADPATTPPPAMPEAFLMSHTVGVRDRRSPSSSCCRPRPPSPSLSTCPRRAWQSVDSITHHCRPCLELPVLPCETVF